MATKHQSHSGSERGGTATAHNGGSSAEQLRSKTSELKQNIQEVGTLARDATQEKLGQLRDTAQEKYSELRSSASEYYNVSRDRAYEWEQSFEDRIRERPLRAVLLATGIGVLLGMCWSRR